MPKLQEKYIPSFDGLLLLYRRYGPAAAEGEKSPPRARANLCLVHGFGEHSDRYAHVCEEFTKVGLIVHTIDLRGHGYSGGPRADGKFDWILRDIGILLQRADPNLPLFVYGHSMGGMAVLKYLQDHPHCRVDGAIIASPLLKLTKDIPWWKSYLLHTCKGVFGEFLISSSIDPCGLSGLHEEVTKVFHDRLSLPFMTVRFADQMLTAADETRTRPHLIDVSVLFVHGDRDEITDPKTTAAFSQEVASDDCTLLMVEGGVHELHNDRHMADTIGTLCRWLVARVEACEEERKNGRYHARALRRTSSSVKGMQKTKPKPKQKAQKSVNEKLLMAVYSAVALLWLTPLAMIMLPTHLAYVILCATVLECDMTPRDVLSILAFGLLHVIKMVKGNTNESVENGGDVNFSKAGSLPVDKSSMADSPCPHLPAYPSMVVETTDADYNGVNGFANGH